MFYSFQVSKALNWDRRKTYHVLKRLRKRGFVRKLSRGLYCITEKFKELLKFDVHVLNGTSKSLSHTTVNDKGVMDKGTRLGFGGFGAPFMLPGNVYVFGAPGCVGVGLSVCGLFFDNVRGFVVSGGYVQGDRGKVVGWDYLGRFDRLSYCEVGCRVSGLPFAGRVMVYCNRGQDGDGVVRVEYRPPSGFVKKNGLAATINMFWEHVLKTAIATSEIILRQAPNHVLKRYLTYLSQRIGPLLK